VIDKEGEKRKHTKGSENISPSSWELPTLNERGLYSNMYVIRYL